ncbi:hypothetical protein Glove_157g83 [Diversispora epigaea]|uniref:Uncharacterized protein n=1 Tax=Diversispora epigaea TaxID=1348612 RepID=A0A397IRX0_9GLOM|nr:hypothetical protein Glove_157g83 [Diversispora epigaea]
MTIYRIILLEVDYLKKNKSKLLTNSTTPTPMNYETHPDEIYNSRLLNCSSLSKPTNDENFDK